MERLEQMFLDGNYCLFQEQTTVEDSLSSVIDTFSSAVDTLSSAVDPLSTATTDATNTESHAPTHKCQTLSSLLQQTLPTLICLNTQYKQILNSPHRKETVNLEKVRDTIAFLERKLTCTCKTHSCEGYVCIFNILQVSRTSNW